MDEDEDEDEDVKGLTTHGPADGDGGDSAAAAYVRERCGLLFEVQSS